MSGRNERKQRTTATAAAACALLVLALTAAACGDDQEPSGTSGPLAIKVGAVLPLTGDLAPRGPVLRHAVELAVQQAQRASQQTDNAAQVSLTIADDETTPQAGQQAASKLAAEGANCLVGAQGSAVTVPVAEAVAKRQQIPQISPGSTSPKITLLDDDGFLFRTVPSDALQGQVLAQLIADSLPGGTANVLSLAARNDAYGEGIITSFRKAWEARGGHVTGDAVLFDPEQASSQSEADRVVAGNPGGFVIVDYEEQFAQLGAALVRTGKFDASRTFTADSLAFADGIPKAIPVAALDGARGTRPTSPGAGAQVQAFNALYTRGGHPRGSFDAQAFDATMLCVLAAVAADSNDGRAIRDALPRVAGPPGRKYTFEQLPAAIAALGRGQDIDYEGVSGPIDFDSHGDVTAAYYDVYRYHGKRFEVVDTLRLDPASATKRHG
ncbi:MAG: branched-chain amino acid transport system substrate-binding protein [Solirubrobacteraceae bacterium]